jgi:hypothetical protein
LFEQNCLDVQSLTAREPPESYAREAPKSMSSPRPMLCATTRQYGGR